MSKKSLIRRNEKRKKIISNSVAKRSSLKKVANNTLLKFEERLSAQIELSKMSKNSSPVRFRNRCAITGRPRGNLSKFGLSRNVVRELASWGHIPGLVKSSW